MEDELTESDVSDEAGDDAPETHGIGTIEGALDPTADSDIAGDIDGNEPGFTFPGPGA